MNQAGITPSIANISYERGYILMGIAMLMIIFVHSINEYDAYTSFCSKALLVPWYGKLGCSIFFFMSGYGLFFSLSRQKDVSFKYLWEHLSKMLFTYLIAFVGVIGVFSFPLTAGQEAYMIDIWKICSLSMPEGTDLWFFKIILCNYILSFLLFRWKISTSGRIMLLSVFHLIFVVFCYVSEIPSYWYVSNLAFSLGMLFAHAKHRIARLQLSILCLSFVVFASYYILLAVSNTNIPMELLVDLAFCPLAAFLVTKMNFITSKWLIFVGKNSLYFYLLNIPIMLAIPSSAMHWSAYFVLNLVLTWAATLVVRPMNNRIFNHR